MRGSIAPVFADFETLRGVGFDLVERARAGDAEAFEALVRSRIDRLHRTACAILGSEADARDATQDAFLAAWRELPRLRDTARFDAWLMRILVNACRMRLRARRRVREVPAGGAEMSEFGGSGGRGYGTGTSMEDKVADAQQMELAFDRLTIDQRTVLVLFHLDHRPIKEIALLLGRPTGTIKWRLHDARRALRRGLEAVDHD